MASEDIKEALKEAAIRIRDEKQAGANTALRVGSLLLAICEALNLETDELAKLFLRKDKDDRSVGHIASDKGFEAGKFVQEASGAACYQDKDGNWHIETDHLRVRKKATFTEIEVQEVHHVGGQMLLTAADMIVEFVYEMEDRYRCYFRKVNSDGREIENLWQVGDQAYCNTFNLTKQADGTLGNHYLWRLVIGTSLDTKDDADTRIFGDIMINTAEYNFTDLSKEICAVDSDAPMAKDEIVSLGYQYGDAPNRQNALILAGAGAGSPYIYEFTGINSFHLPEPETRIKPGDNLFSGVMRIKGGSTGAQNLEDFPEEVFKAVHVGAVNLLLNSGFTGDYKTEDLNTSYTLNSGYELFSKGMKHWTGTATITDDIGSVSGKSAVIGSLSQSVQLMKGEGYVVSFRAKGTNVKIMLGGDSVGQELTSEYIRYSFKFISDGVGSFAISGDATICDLQLERGTIATDWNPSPYDNDKTLAEFQALKYIQDAIREGDTSIIGGLILSSMIQLGNYKDGKMQKVTAGMSGLYNDDNDIAFWAGGTLEQAIRTMVKFKENPHYKPTESEWSNLASFVVSHGGDAVFRGSIFANSGIFRGRLEAEEGFLHGKFETSVEGNRIVIDPEDKSFKMYNGAGLEILSITFVNGGENWTWGEVNLKRYNYDSETEQGVLAFEARMTASNIDLYNRIDNTWTRMTTDGYQVTASANGRHYNTITALAKRYLDDGTFIYQSRVQSDCWASAAENVGTGEIYAEPEYNEGGQIISKILKVKV